MHTGALDDELHAAGFTRVAGCDEAGRGALAGPLVAAAVVLPPGWMPDGLTDSKLLTRLQRERMYGEIVERAVSWSVRRISNTRLDRIGLQPTNISALREALSGLDVAPDYVLVDGFRLPRLSAPTLRVYKGDMVSAAVAAASVIAKVTRDRMMVRYARRHPGYGFERNKGYGAQEHRDGLAELGPCAIHRRCFAGVAAMIAAEQSATATTGELQLAATS